MRCPVEKLSRIFKRICFRIKQFRHPHARAPLWLCHLASMSEGKVQRRADFPVVPSLAYAGSGGRVEFLTPTSVTIDAEVYIATAFVKATFEFRNETRKKHDFMFALPTEDVVTHVEADVGKRLVDTAIISTDDLDALQKSSHGAGPEALAEAQVGLFRMPISKVKRGETVQVRCEFIQDLVFSSLAHTYNFRLAWSLENSTVKSINFAVHSPVPGVRFDSQTHSVAVDGGEVKGFGGRFKIKLLPKESSTSNEIALSYVMPTTQIFGALMEQQAGTAGASRTDPRGSFVMFVAPPTITAGQFPRDIVFLLDRSGSMAGAPFENAVRALGAALGRLREFDYFTLGLYNHEFKATLFKGGSLHPATPKNCQAAVDYLNENGPSGATDIDGPLTWALDLLSRAQRPGGQQSLKMVVLVTDGCVTGEEDICNKVQRVMEGKASTWTRIHTVGIGPYCNHQFLKMLSKVGRGFHTNVVDVARDPNAIFSKTMALMDSVSFPILSNVSLGISVESCELYPFPIPDLFKGAPLTIAGKFTGTFPKTVALQGVLPNGAMFRQQISAASSNVLPVDKIFAKNRIDALTARHWLTKDEKLRNQIIELSCEQRVPSAFTTLVAYETTHEKRQKEDEKSEKKGKNSTNKAAAVGALAVGGVLAIGAGVYLLGGSAAISATANGLSSVGSDAANVLGQGFSGLIDCCNGCCGGLCESVGPVCGSLQPLCGSIGDACGSCEPILGACGGGLKNICGPACQTVAGSAAGICETCGDGVWTCLSNVGMLCGSLGELPGVCGNLVGSCADLDLKCLGDCIGAIAKAF